MTNEEKALEKIAEQNKKNQFWCQQEKDFSNCKSIKEYNQLTKEDD